MNPPLSPRLRRALELERCGLSAEKAAALLGVSPAALRMRLKRARAAASVGRKPTRPVAVYPAPLGDIRNF